MGGANNVTGAETQSGFYNPAGLGHLRRTQIGMTVRNLPKSTTFVTGDIHQGNGILNTTGSTGPRALTHFGLAVPLKARSGKSNGTVSVAMTTGGVIRDERFSGAGLTDNGTALPFYYQLVENRTDWVSLAYGKSTSDQSFNWGVALLYAQNHQRNFRVNTTSEPIEYDEKAHGWGGLFGVQYIPKSLPNVVLGLSYRTPISLKGGNGVNLLYDKIPGRLEGGIAYRLEGLRHGQDYAVLGAEVQHFDKGHASVLFDRGQTQTLYGFGLEYDYNLGGFRLPLRAGYNYLPAGGTDYGSRNTLTFGLGFRPTNNDWGVDLNFARPQHGGTDMALNLFYRFGG
jgi:hypothetical protein